MTTARVMRPSVISFALYSHARAVDAAAFAIHLFDTRQNPADTRASWPHITGVLFQADCAHVKEWGRPISGEEWRVTSQGLRPDGLAAVLDGDPVARRRLRPGQAEIFRAADDPTDIRAVIPNDYAWPLLSESDREAIWKAVPDWRRLSFEEALHHGRRLAIPLMSPGGRIPYENILEEPELIEHTLGLAGFGHF